MSFSYSFCLFFCSASQLFVVIVFCQEPLGTAGQNQFRDLRSAKLICEFQFRGLPPSASGVTRRTRGEQEQERGGEGCTRGGEDPATRDGSIGMLAGSINPRGGRRAPCNRMTEFNGGAESACY